MRGKKGGRSVKSSDLILISVGSNIICLFFMLYIHFFLHFAGSFISVKGSTFNCNNTLYNFVI